MRCGFDAFVGALRSLKAKEDIVLKTMKKVLAIVLAILMLSGMMVMFNSCGKVTAENPGAIINIYMPYSVNLDPATAYADETSAKLLSLLYEGLVTLNSKGKAESGVAKSWEIYTDRDGQTIIDFELNETRWSDGTSVDAEDFVESWERILNPEFSCEAAPLLFAIKNAAKVKRGEESISDLGIRATSQKTLTVILEDWADPEQFIRNCASVALYPIRRDIINKVVNKETGKENDWSSIIAIMQSNGPFFLKGMSFGTSADGGQNAHPYIVLERNTNYFLDPEKAESLDKYVVPYRIQINMTYGHDDTADFLNLKYQEYRSQNPSYESTRVEQLKAAMSKDEYNALGKSEPDRRAVLTKIAADEKKVELADIYSVDYAKSILEKIRENKLYYYNAYNEGTMLYNASLPATEEIEDVDTVNSMTTGAFYFNTTNEILDDAKVRQALSLALDRDAIAALVKNGKAAGTLITGGVFETKRKTSFVKNSTDYALSTSANVDSARALLAEAGVSGGRFTITVRATETDIMIAQYAAEVWESLGFSVGIKACGYDITTYVEKQYVTTDKKDENGRPIKEWTDTPIYDGLLHDSYLDDYNNSNFDVILVDVNMLSTDAFVALAPFAGVFSSRAYNFANPEDFDKLVYGVTGYYNAEYDALLSAAMVETDAAKRAELLHQAEALLLTDMPITPVIHFTTSYLESRELDDVDYTYFGAPDFTGTSYDDYVPVVEEEEAPEEEGTETEEPAA